MKRSVAIKWLGCEVSAALDNLRYIARRSVHGFIFRRCGDKEAPPWVSASLQRPERQRSDVFDEHPIARDGRLGPGRAVGDRVPFHRFKSGLTAPRHYQLGVVVQHE